MKFEFIEFNPRRAMRGAPAARVQVVYDDGTEDWVWMSKNDIPKNVLEFGQCEALTLAHQAYKAFP